jgi:hypothetical protein
MFDHAVASRHWLHIPCTDNSDELKETQTVSTAWLQLPDVTAVANGSIPCLYLLLLCRGAEVQCAKVITGAGARQKAEDESPVSSAVHGRFTCPSLIEVCGPGP